MGKNDAEGYAAEWMLNCSDCSGVDSGFHFL